MTDVQAMVAEFHGAFNLPNRLGQGKPDAMHERTELRKDLIDEEFDEFLDSHETTYVGSSRLGFYHELVELFVNQVLAQFGALMHSIGLSLAESVGQAKRSVELRHHSLNISHR